jgi:ribosomal protein L37AE/L43A
MDEQIKILEEIQATGFNIITCGLCGEVNLVRKGTEMFTCYACSEKQQHHDCADLFF